ncbi:type IV toxin-antitoxin system AbiEi family antitoxin domain-containing protein, partial [Pseudactinotalea sp.]|uniref:type IV toxin-antitoxin system AbiEi family antitoxin domain-containing protein n=1 Tax=Pseudactinotalea sp. TaxID=1926260 RepID=UPI003B3AC1CC
MHRRPQHPLCARACRGSREPGCGMRYVTIPPPLLTLAADQAGLVAAHQCEHAGLSAHSRRRLVDAGTWGRVARGLYNTRTVTIRADDWDGRRARAFWHGMLAAGPDAVAVGLGALW